MLEFIRKLLPYTAILCGLAALYLAWTFFLRWNTNREIQRGAETKSVEAAKQTTDLLGGGTLKILSFYAPPGRLCYGVANAKSVRIEPGVERIWPSLGRCFDLIVKHQTTYTLIAEDGEGHTASQSIDLKP